MLDVHDLPCLTRDIPGIGGTLKSRPEDFVVVEESLYEPCGRGTHVYFRIRKRGIPTMQAVQEIARALGRQVFEIGYAGLKDADAVTTQMLSLEHVDPARIQALKVPGIEVVSISRHTNKLKLGHLKGNRFRIRIRNVDPARVGDAAVVLEILARRGAPNYFGPQRFGLRGDTWRIGRALLRHDYDEALAVMAGRAGPADRGDILKARTLFDHGDYAGAAAAWPYMFRNERRACRAMAESGGNARKAIRAVDPHVRRFYLSAFQSVLFNQIVARRIDALDRLLAGDLAWRHPQGAVFRVEDPAREQPRCDAFEISPTGPLYGHRMTEPAGEPGDMERRLLEEQGLDPGLWKAEGRRLMSGGRRPLRFRPHDAVAGAGTDQAGPYIELRFFLESGCYATTVLREVCKTDTPARDCDPAAEEAE